MSREHIKAMTLIDPGDSGPESALERLILFGTDGKPLLLGGNIPDSIVVGSPGVPTIQSAIDAAASSSSETRTVVIPDGIWVETVKLRSFVKVVCGLGAIIKAPTNTLSSAVVSLLNGDQERCEWYGGTIDGNAVNQTGEVHGLQIQNTNNGAGFPSGRLTPGHKIHPGYIHHTSGDGFRVDGDAWSGECEFGDTQVYYANGYGVYISGADHNIGTFDVGQSGKIGVVLAASNSRLGLLKSWYSGRLHATEKHGVLVSGRRNQCALMEAQDNRGHGFVFTSASFGNTLFGTADSNGQTTDDGSGFVFESGASGNKVNGVTFDRAPTDRVGGALPQEYAVTIVAGAFRNSIDVLSGALSGSPLNGVPGDNEVRIVSTVGHTPMDVRRSGITPSANTTYDLGSSSARWNNIWGGTISAFHKVINAAAGGARDLLFQTSGTKRWGIQANATAEGGSSAGSNFQVDAYNDAGTLVPGPLLYGERVSGCGVLRVLYIDTTGLTSAQIDTAVTNRGVTAVDHMLIHDAQNSLLLTRNNGKWCKTAAMTQIA